MIMEPLGATLGVSALAALLGPVCLIVHFVVSTVRSPRPPERVVLFLGTALGALGMASLVFVLLMVGYGIGHSDAPDSSTPDSVTRLGLAFTFGPAALILAAAVMAAVRRMTITARLLAVAPTAVVVLLVVPLGVGLV